MQNYRRRPALSFPPPYAQRRAPHPCRLSFLPPTTHSCTSSHRRICSAGSPCCLLHSLVICSSGSMAEFHSILPHAATTDLPPPMMPDYSSTATTVGLPCRLLYATCIGVSYPSLSAPSPFSMVDLSVQLLSSGDCMSQCLCLTSAEVEPRPDISSPR